MEQPTQEQIKRFWEGYGFEELPRGSHDKFKRLLAIKYPDGTVHSDYPPTDLNNLFKYAVPKAREKMFMLNLSSGVLASNTTVTLHSSPKHTYQGFDKDPALALFWALDKVREVDIR